MLALLCVGCYFLVAFVTQVVLTVCDYDRKMSDPLKPPNPSWLVSLVWPIAGSYWAVIGSMYGLMALATLLGRAIRRTFHKDVQ